MTLVPRMTPSLFRGFSSSCTPLSRFVPQHDPVQEEDIETLMRLVNQHRPISVLTGAGVSTESGLPGPEGIRL